MLILSRSRSSSVSVLVRHQSISLKSFHLSLRTYATSPQPRPYKYSKSAPKSATGLKSTLSTKPSVIPLQSTLATPTPSPRINPPPSTLPPPLDLPKRTLENGQKLEWYMYYYRLGRAYGGFYMAGLKAILANYKRKWALLEALPSGSITSIRQAVKDGTLSRADFQSIIRSKDDMSKLPPFILLWCVCGEFTPLIIVFVTGLVPKVLWIPTQVQQFREKAEERRRSIRLKSALGEKPMTAIIRENLLSSPGPTSQEAYQYLAQSLFLYSPWWDRFASSFIPNALLRRRVEARLKDLDVDDFAIARDGGVRNLDGVEVLKACDERGINVLGREVEDLRKELEGWIQDRKTNH